VGRRSEAPGVMATLHHTDICWRPEGVDLLNVADDEQLLSVARSYRDLSRSCATSSMNIEHTHVRTRSTGNCRMPTVTCMNRK